MNVRPRRVETKAAKATPRVPRRRPGRPRVDDKRRRILDAALAMFAERGYHGVAVPEVAVAAGVGIGTLYHYFEHKQQLVNEVCSAPRSSARRPAAGSAETLYPPRSAARVRS
jgi:AcrR family transcriptional regulator